MASLNLSEWSQRAADVLARMVRENRQRFAGQDIYLAALCTADVVDACRFGVVTQQWFDARVAADPDSEWLESYRWWPDESGLDLDETCAVETAAAFRLLDDELVDYAWAEAGEAGRAERLDAATGALCDALGAPQVRAAFGALGCDPLLVVTETDGDYRRSLSTFVALNPGRDDERYRSALAYWQSCAGPEDATA